MTRSIVVVSCGGGKPGETGGGGRGLFRSFGVQGETGDVYILEASDLNEEFVFIPSFVSFPREAVCCTVAVTGFPWRCSGVDGFTLPAPIKGFSSTPVRSALEGDTSSEVRGVSWW